VFEKTGKNQEAVLNTITANPIYSDISSDASSIELDASERTDGIRRARLQRNGLGSQVIDAIERSAREA
jgi:hypothetical protein